MGLFCSGAKRHSRLLVSEVRLLPSRNRDGISVVREQNFVDSTSTKILAKAKIFLQWRTCTPSRQGCLVKIKTVGSAHTRKLFEKSLTKNLVITAQMRGLVKF